jgi:mannose-6-phosphate isomerase-like protein (cupin superfamily)
MIARKRTLDVLKSAQEFGNYDEVPVLVAEADPQLHVSRNSVPQPFSLTCEKDSVLVQMTGEARVLFDLGNVRSFELEMGDHVYVPGGTPHRVVPKTEGVQVRYKAREPGLESASWYCSTCAEEVFVLTWDTAESLSQRAFADACRAFNSDPANRTCPACGCIAPPVDLTPFTWDRTAVALAGPAQES